MAEYSFVHQPPAGTWAAAGVPGGVPDTSGWTLTDLTGTVLTNGTDQGGTINTAISAASANTVLLLPSGTITISTRINGNKDNIVLRGRWTEADGWLTILNFTANDILVRGNETLSAAYTVSADVAAGATVIPISGSLTGLAVGKMVRLWQDNDITAATPTIDVSAQLRLASQWTMITAVGASSITVSPAVIDPLVFARAPQVFQVTTTRKNFGVEDMKLDATNKASSGPVQFWATQSCWLHNCWVYNVAGYSIWTQSGNCQLTFSHNTVDTNRTLGPNRAGMKLDCVSSLLVTDNIFIEVFPGTEMNGVPGAGGSMGNVISYNYFHSMPTGASDVVGYAMDTNHGAATGYDLYEGNVGPKFVHDGYYGTSFNVTAFRNWFQGKDVDPLRVQHMQCVSLQRFARNYSVVGNILGTPGTAFTYDAGNSGGLAATHYIYKLGYPGVENFATDGTAQPSVGDWWTNYNMTGTLTTRTSDTAGVVTFTNGATKTNQYMRLTHSGGSTVFSSGGTYSAPTLTLSGGTGAILPAAGSAVVLTTNTDGWDEMDLDVRASLVRIGNYNTQDAGIPAGESLAGQTLPNSLYLSSKPASFGPLPWPAFDVAAPNFVIEVIPAGYRFTYGFDPVNQPSASTGLRSSPSLGVGF